MDQIQAHQTPAPKGKEAEFPLPPHEDFDITTTWHNMYVESSFCIFRKESRGPIERILANFGNVLSTGVFQEVYSVTAT